MKLSGKFLPIALIAAILLSCPSLGGRQTAIPEEQAGAAQSADGSFSVPQDVYEQTFAEVEALISRLNEIIAEKNYEEWLTYLSPDYIEKTGSPVFLREASKSQILQKDKIVLRNLQDYFLHVVVPSRVQVKLEKISFLDKTHVKAIAVIDEKPVMLYWLVLIDSRWMIGVP